MGKGTESWQCKIESNILKYNLLIRTKRNYTNNTWLVRRLGVRNNSSLNQKVVPPKIFQVDRKEKAPFPLWSWNLRMWPQSYCNHVLSPERKPERTRPTSRGKNKERERYWSLFISNPQWPWVYLVCFRYFHFGRCFNIFPINQCFTLISSSWALLLATKNPKEYNVDARVFEILVQTLRGILKIFAAQEWKSTLLKEGRMRNN